ncbi:GTP cyclohydrolase I [Methylohalomonas lacus]|uniref:GTP cyclohydrolase FolE2 n=2 Tax=Methylohalomonas lacus TaxID=398773 RepID=A0AAE3HK60_9GAMM|nr:GTP cyclohydrolase I [Methylohalomonas lacus]
MKILNYLEPSIYGCCSMDTKSYELDNNDSSSSESALLDVQSSLDERDIAIDCVGIKDIKLPVTITDYTGDKQNTVATFNMYVGLPGNAKGTHMSRFVKILNSREHEFNSASFRDLIKEVTDSLESETAYIEMAFPYFMEKSAPVSGASGLLNYDVALIGEIRAEDTLVLSLRVIVPVTTLCPCAREISDYGAHSQRSHVTILLETDDHIWIEEIIGLVESKASCELYSQLKGSDEKFVTEKAYDNPRFVEDIVRDIASALAGDRRIGSYSVESENFESIHNHSAYARISSY